MKVSILLLTINRYHHTQEYIGKALANSGYDRSLIDLCIADNGSIENDIFDWCEKQRPKVYIRHGYNKGTTQALNQLIAINPSDAYVFLGNDIEMPNNWLREAVNVATNVPNTGMIGWDWRGQAKRWAKETINGISLIPTSNVFGSTFITQKALDEIGSFCEDYGVYGLWDSDCALRCQLAGLNNYYIDGMYSEHKGDDVGEKSEYRKMKDESLKNAKPIFDANVKRYKETGEIFIPNKNINYNY